MSYLDEKIELVDKNKVVRIRLQVDNKGNPSLSLNDSDGRERLILSVDDDGNGSLGFRTAKGQPTVSLGMSSDLGSGMMVLDVQNEICLTLGIVNGNCQIRLDTRDGVYSWPTDSSKIMTPVDPTETKDSNGPNE